MDWRGVTQAWVREGLVTEAQREPLLRWLQEHAPPERWVFDRVWPALVAIASWMLTGSAWVVADEWYPSRWSDGGFAFVGALQVAVGAVAHRRGQDALGTGFASAGLLVFALSAAGHAPGPHGALAAGIGVAAVAAAVAAALRSRGAALSGTVGALWVAFGWLDAGVTRLEAALVVLASLAVSALGAVALRRLPWLAPADLVALFPTLAVLRVSWEATAGGRLHSFGAALSAASFGLALLALGAFGRSAGLLAAGVLAFVFAEGYLLDGVSDRLLAATVLGAEGLLLLAGAVGVGLWRAGRLRRPLAP
jgi:hypothetical protein